MIFNFKPQGEMEGHLFGGEGLIQGSVGTLKSSISIKTEKKIAKNLCHHSLVVVF